MWDEEQGSVKNERGGWMEGTRERKNQSKKKLPCGLHGYDFCFLLLFTLSRSYYWAVTI